MIRMQIPPWAVVAAALVAPAAAYAQGATVVCKDGSNAPTASACTEHGGVDSITTRAAQQARPSQGVETGQVDSTAATGVTSDTGVTGVTGTATDTSASADTGRIRPDTGMAEMRSDTGMTGMSSDTGMTGQDSSKANVKTDTALKAKPGVQTGKRKHYRKHDSTTVDSTTAAPDSTH